MYPDSGNAGSNFRHRPALYLASIAVPGVLGMCGLMVPKVLGYRLCQQPSSFWKRAVDIVERNLNKMFPVKQGRSSSDRYV